MTTHAERLANLYAEHAADPLEYIRQLTSYALRSGYKFQWVAIEFKHKMGRQPVQHEQAAALRVWQKQPRAGG